MSGIVGPNGQPVTDVKQTIDIPCGGCNLTVFRDPRVLVPIQAVQGQEIEVFMEMLKKLNAHNVYVNAIVRELAALQARLDTLEQAAAEPAVPELFPGPG